MARDGEQDLRGRAGREKSGERMPAEPRDQRALQANGRAQAAGQEQRSEKENVFPRMHRIPDASVIFMVRHASHLLFRMQAFHTIRIPAGQAFVIPRVSTKQKARPEGSANYVAARSEAATGRFAAAGVRSACC
jgi:hypothetical protein